MAVGVCVVLDVEAAAGGGGGGDDAQAGERLPSKYVMGGRDLDTGERLRQ